MITAKRRSRPGRLGISPRIALTLRPKFFGGGEPGRAPPGDENLSALANQPLCGRETYSAARYDERGFAR